MIETTDDVMVLMEYMMTTVLISFIFTVIMCFACRKHIHSPILDEKSAFMSSFVAEAKESQPLQKIEVDMTDDIEMTE